jgi:uncharacterized protein (TIGR03083 family)
MAADRPGIPTVIIDTLTGVWRAWSELGHGITETQWKTQTDLPAWSVQDNLSHLIGIERLLEGFPAAPRRDPPEGSESHVRNTIGDFNENEVELRRGLPGAAVLAEWDELIATREHTLAAAEAAYYAQPMITPVGPGTMTDFLSVRIVDCWVHEQDARRALDMPGNESGAAAEHSIDRLLRSLPMVVGKRAACPEGCAVEFELTGPVRRHVTCEVRDGRAVVVDHPARPPRATVAMDSQTYVVLANGRRPVDDVADRVTVTATETAGDELGRRVVGGLNVMV